MLVDTFAKRLQKALDINQMKPIQLSEKTGLDKSLISNYLSGNYKAKQDKLSLLADALNVSETWLMGYDVPLNDNNSNNKNMTELDQVLFSKVKELSEEDKKAVLGVINAIHKDIDKELDN